MKRLADALLDAAYDFQGEHKRWLTFGVPRVWDLLSALKALAVHGYGSDPRFQAAACFVAGAPGRARALDLRLSLAHLERRAAQPPLEVGHAGCAAGIEQDIKE